MLRSGPVPCRLTLRTGQPCLVELCSSEAEQRSSGQRRILYLDIDGHRNDKGGYDPDMHELQTHFILEFLMPFLAVSHLPIGLRVANPEPQRDDIPNMLEIRAAGS